MFVYYILYANKLKGLLSSMLLPLNVLNNNIVYKKIPEVEEGCVLVKLELNTNELRDLEYLSKYTYKLDRGLNLESRRFYLIFKSKEHLDIERKKLTMYKEIKLDYDTFTNLSTIYEKREIDNYKKDLEDRNGILTNNSLKMNRKMDILKGILYGAIFDNNYFNKYAINNYSKCINELLEVNNTMESLRRKKLLSNTLYLKSNSLKKELEKSIIKNLEEFPKEKLIFDILESKKIQFNDKFLNIEENEKIFFEKILNFCLDSMEKYENEKDKISILLKYISKLVTKDEKFIVFIDDLKLLNNRFFKEDYSIDINKIKSLVIKNIYVIAIKYNNLKEFHSYVAEKKIEKSYLAYIIYGAIKGYTFMPLSLISNSSNSSNSYTMSAIKSNIINIETNLYDKRYNINSNRNKIYYYLNILFNYLDKINRIDEKKIKIIRKEEKLKKFEVYHKDIIMEVEYHKRNKKIAKSIKYFDKRNYKLKNSFKGFEPLKSNIFNYRFNIRNKIKPIDYRFEYYFSVILEELYLEFNRRENYNE